MKLGEGSTRAAVFEGALEVPFPPDPLPSFTLIRVGLVTFTRRTPAHLLTANALYPSSTPPNLLINDQRLHATATQTKPTY